MKQAITVILVIVALLLVVLFVGNSAEETPTGEALNTAEFAPCAQDGACWQAYSDCVETSDCQLVYQLDEANGVQCLNSCLADAKTATLS